jgi:hypothetical protein
VRRKRGPKNSSWRGEYVIARVVHVREKKTRLREVDQLDSIGMAKMEASGREIGARRDASDIAPGGDRTQAFWRGLMRISMIVCDTRAL